jgi:hypothetical protein
MYNDRPVLLPNIWGDAASSFVASSTPDAAYAPLYDLISGPRSTITRWGASSSSRTLEYTTASANYFTHLVLARADLALRNNTGADLGFTAEYYLGSYGAIPGEYRVTSDLVGIDSFGLGHGQDLVFINTVRGQGTKIKLTADYDAATVSTGLGLSKFYACDAFDFGVEPRIDPRPAWYTLSKDRGNYERFAKPLQGNMTYEIEATITLEWPHVSVSSFTDFLAIPQLLNWPLFIYDPQSYLWAHKLEHVIVRHYGWTQTSPDHGSLQITFGRLAHYE